MTKTDLARSALELPPDERMDLVETLWESLEREPPALPDWQRQLLDERLADLERHPEDGSSWEEVRERIWPNRG